ncbi:hypothetical protein [Nonomuraea typhae]|uniref:Uncharacterized protein n=1 Tax=Nonomuraea typhae TaxID=2603600 RepID=A0ABW7YNK3_9ACTN
MKRSVEIRTVAGWTDDSGSWDDNMPGGVDVHEVTIDETNVEDAIKAALDVLYRHGCTETTSDPGWPYRADLPDRHNGSLEERQARLVGFSKSEEAQLRAALPGRRIAADG